MGPVLYPTKNEETYGIVSYQNFSMSFCITFKKKTAACGSHVAMSHQDCSACAWVSGSTGACDPLSTLFCKANLEIYKHW